MTILSTQTVDPTRISRSMRPLSCPAAFGGRLKPTGLSGSPQRDAIVYPLGRRSAVLMSISPAMTWYVSFIAGANLADDRAHRGTKNFAGEHEAKKFARAR